MATVFQGEVLRPVQIGAVFSPARIKTMRAPSAMAQAVDAIPHGPHPGGGRDGLPEQNGDIQMVPAVHSPD